MSKYGNEVKFKIPAENVNGTIVFMKRFNKLVIKKLLITSTNKRGHILCNNFVISDFLNKKDI